MFIKNKILRFIVSFLVAILIYWLIMFFYAKGDFEQSLKRMLTYLMFLFFLTIPIIGFVIYKINIFLTPIADRSKNGKRKNVAISVIVGMLVLMLILLYILSN